MFAPNVAPDKLNVSNISLGDAQSLFTRLHRTTILFMGVAFGVAFDKKLSDVVFDVVDGYEPAVKPKISFSPPADGKIIVGV
jgi:hypothetical protein